MQGYIICTKFIENKAYGEYNVKEYNSDIL